MKSETKKIIEEIYGMLDSRIETINKRTKNHTIDIRELRKRIKELEK